jgi:hypothetical protein
MAVDIKWHPAIVVNATKAEIAKRMRGAMLIVQGDAQRRLSVGTATRRTASGRIVALTKAAPPPTAPRALSGALRKSITSDVVMEPGAVIGRVGSNLVYARRQELGFTGTDSQGRNVDAGERPFLRPALFENLRRVVARLGGK